MPTPDHLPTPEEGVDGIMKFARGYGEEETFQLLRLCRTAQTRATDVAGAVMRRLATRMVDQKTAALRSAQRSRRPGWADSIYDTARRSVAADLGYWERTRDNFYLILDAAKTDTGDLPDRADELLRLVETYGEQQTFRFMLMARTAENRDTDYAGQALHLLAVHLVDEEMRVYADYDTARREVSDRLGYSPPREGNGRSNFYALLRGGRPADSRPNGAFRLR